MPGFEILEKFRRRSGAAMRNVIQSLANAFPGIGTRSDVQQALVSLGILDHRRSPSIHRQN
jgi:hypothetical protein